MLRSLFCAAAVFSLLLSIFLLPQTVSARRCGGEIPETLLSLYQKSDGIYIATFDKLVEGDITDHDENYSIQDVKKHFSISSTLKGANRKFVVLKDDNYIYKNPAPAPPAAEAAVPLNEEPPTADEPEPEEEEDDSEVKLNSGDTLILFLTEGDEGTGPALTHYSYGLKKRSMQGIGVYEARIKELNSIFSARKVNERHLLEWLIRCAEDPVTRWEGTFELLQSVRDREWREEEARQRRESLARGEPVEEAAPETDTPAEENEDEEAEADVKLFDTGIFAKILDAGDKQRIANLLFQSPQANVKDDDGSVSGNYELLELVKRWDDPRLIGFLLDKLRAGADDTYTNSNTMSIVAEVLDDKKVSELAARFEENAYEGDDAAIEAAEEEKPGPETPAAEADTPAGPAGDGTGTPELEGPPVAAEKTAEKKRTYADLRSELIGEFLARCELVIAAKEQMRAEENEINNTR